MTAIYKVFEFKAGHRVPSELPVCYISVDEGASKFEALAEELDQRGLPGEAYSYGFEEVTDFVAEVQRLKNIVTSVVDNMEWFHTYVNKTIDNIE